jgi:hypothetical protein
LTKGQAAIRDCFHARHDRTGNLPLFPGIFPNQFAPIVRNNPDGRELVMARWGMPGPLQFGGSSVTNIRNVSSPHRRRWLGNGSRCAAPASSFGEYADTKPRQTPTWFALSEDRPLFGESIPVWSAQRQCGAAICIVGATSQLRARFDCGHQLQCLFDFGQLQCWRKPLQSGRERVMRLGRAAGRLVELRQRKHRAQFKAASALLLRDSDGGLEGPFCRRGIGGVALRQDIAARRASGAEG